MHQPIGSPISCVHSTLLHDATTSTLDAQPLQSLNTVPASTVEPMVQPDFICY